MQQSGSGHVDACTARGEQPQGGSVACGDLGRAGCIKPPRLAALEHMGYEEKLKCT